MRQKLFSELRTIYETTAEDPFKNGGTSTVGFADSASVSGGRIPMKLSKPVNEECNVYYTVWDYDSGSVLREGTLHFDRFETEKCIYAGENENNILIEISGVQNIARGKNCFHYLKQERNTYGVIFQKNRLVISFHFHGSRLL